MSIFSISCMSLHLNYFSWVYHTWICFSSVTSWISILSILSHETSTRVPSLIDHLDNSINKSSSFQEISWLVSDDTWEWNDHVILLWFLGKIRGGILIWLDGFVRGGIRDLVDRTIWSTRVGPPPIIHRNFWRAVHKSQLRAPVLGPSLLKLLSVLLTVGRSYENASSREDRLVTGRPLRYDLIIVLPLDAVFCRPT